jgi:hypothetical protein
MASVAGIASVQRKGVLVGGHHGAVARGRPPGRPGDGCPAVRGGRHQPDHHRFCGCADVYGEVQRRAGVPADWQVLVLSCFAITPVWTPARLAEGTGFSLYRTVRAEVLFAAGVPLWPTEVFWTTSPTPATRFTTTLSWRPGRI